METEPPIISPRARSIITACAAGKTHKQVAIALGISLSTVKSHIHRCYTSLGVHSMLEAYVEMNRYYPPLSSLELEQVVVVPRASRTPRRWMRPRRAPKPAAQVELDQGQSGMQLVININLPAGSIQSQPSGAQSRVRKLAWSKPRKPS